MVKQGESSSNFREVALTKQEFLEKVKTEWYLEDYTAEVVDWAIADNEVTRAHYRSNQEQLQDNTLKEEHYVVTNRHLLKFSINASNINYVSFQLDDIVKVEQTFALPSHLKQERSFRDWKKSCRPKIKITFSSNLPEEERELVLPSPEEQFRKDFKNVIKVLSSRN